jgi:DNA repair protein RadC
MEKPHYHGHRQRLRERLERAPSGLADYELLELLLALCIPRQDTKPLAKELLHRFSTLRGALYAPEADLAAIKGMGPATVAAFRLLRETWARLQEQPLTRREVLPDARTVADAARARFGVGREEELWAAYLDLQNRALAWERIASGAEGEIHARPRDVLAPALRHQAARIILVHNHPGGTAWPSEEDKHFTLAVARAAQAVQVAVVDHVVVTESDYFSFQEKDLL